MKRSTILYIIIAVSVILTGVVASTLQQSALIEYKLFFQVFIVIPLGALWIRAFIDGSKGN
jgi:hypothetical protein